MAEPHDGSVTDMVNSMGFLSRMVYSVWEPEVPHGSVIFLVR